MINKLPLYIPVKQLQSMPYVHQWDDWNPYSLISKNDSETEKLLYQVTDNAKYVFSLGCAEWVVSRFSQDLKDSRAWDYLDACWAYEVIDGYQLPIELNDREWLGPILGPICLALTTVINTRYGFDEGNAEIDSAFAEQIALYVMPDSTIFKEWRNSILNRMLKLCKDKNNSIAVRLPRDILDPSSEIIDDNYEKLCSETFKELKVKENAFVRVVKK